MATAKFDTCILCALQVKELVAAAGGADSCLVLFSGDAFNPSLMSTQTLGKQMVRDAAINWSITCFSSRRGKP
jgi:hypothetical protein